MNNSVRANLSSLFRRMPVEAHVALYFICAWAIGVAAGLPVCLPTWASLKLLQQYFVGTSMFAVCLPFCVSWIVGRRNRRLGQTDPYIVFKLIPFVSLALLLHFNFKAWMPLINPSLYDDNYRSIDGALSPLLECFLLARSFIASHTTNQIDNAYQLAFFLMFFVSLSVHTALDSTQRQRQLVLGTCLILLLGGISYWLAPALGPFLYRRGLNAVSSEGQQELLRLFLQFRAMGIMPVDYFGAAPAAMPSLHISHALFFVMFAARSVRWLCFIYLPVLLWIVIESVASGWHYLIDLPAGAVLAILCLFMARVLMPEVKKCSYSRSITEDSASTVGQVDCFGLETVDFPN